MHEPKRQRTVDKQQITFMGELNSELSGAGNNMIAIHGDDESRDDKKLEIGTSHWDQTHFLNIGFKGGRPSWQKDVSRVCIELYGTESDTGLELSQRIAFDPTSPKVKWDDGDRKGTSYPGFSQVIGIDYGNQNVEPWNLKVTIDLKG